MQHHGGEHQHDDDSRRAPSRRWQQRVAGARGAARDGCRGDDPDATTTSVSTVRRLPRRVPDDRGRGASTRRGSAARRSASAVSAAPARRARRARRPAGAPTWPAGWRPARPADGRLGTPRTRRTVCTAPHTHGRSGGQSQDAGGRAEALLDDAVLAGVVREHGDPAHRPGGFDGRVEGDGQGVELAVDLDADGLERALGRVAAGAPGGGGDRRGHDRRQLDRRLDRAGGDDRPGDAGGEALVAEVAG